MRDTAEYANPLMCAPAHGGRAGIPGDRSPGRRPSLPYAVARLLLPVPRDSQRRPLPATRTAPTRPCATPFIPFTNAVSQGGSRTVAPRTLSTIFDAGACESLRALSP